MSIKSSLTTGLLNQFNSHGRLVGFIAHNSPLLRICLSTLSIDSQTLTVHEIPRFQAPQGVFPGTPAPIGLLGRWERMTAALPTGINFPKDTRSHAKFTETGTLKTKSARFPHTTGPQQHAVIRKAKRISRGFPSFATMNLLRAPHFPCIAKTPDFPPARG